MSQRKRKFNGSPFVALYHWEMDCPAYRCLSTYGRSLLLEFRRLYNTHNNGKIVMSARQAARLLNCNKDTATKVLRELEYKGWIRQTSKGSFSQKTDKTASTWRITNQPVGLGVDEPETKEYARWQSGDEIQNTVPRKRTACPTTSDRERKSGLTKSDHTPPNCPTTSDREGPDTPSNGPIKPDTSISTIRGVAQLAERR